MRGFCMFFQNLGQLFVSELILFSVFCVHVLLFVMLCCAVPCYAVSCHAVMCCVCLCCVVLCYVSSCFSQVSSCICVVLRWFLLFITRMFLVGKWEGHLASRKS